jgi:hypothetical protein
VSAISVFVFALNISDTMDIDADATDMDQSLYRRLILLSSTAYFGI